LRVINVKLISDEHVYVLNTVRILQQWFPTFPLNTTLICSPVSLNTNNHKIKNLFVSVYPTQSHTVRITCSFSHRTGFYEHGSL